MDDIFGRASGGDVAHLGVRLAITYIALLTIARIVGYRTPRPAGRELIFVAMLGGLVAPALIRPEDAPILGLVGIVSVASVDYIISRLAFVHPPFARRLYPEPIVLIESGEVQRRNLAREGMTFESSSRCCASRDIDWTR